MKILKSENQNFFKDLKFFLQKRLQQNIKDIDESVKKIINQIIQNGDEALFKYTKEFDGSLIDSSNVLISKKIRESYKSKADINVLQSFKVSPQIPLTRLARLSLYPLRDTNRHPNRSSIMTRQTFRFARTAAAVFALQSFGAFVPRGITNLTLSI